MASGNMSHSAIWDDSALVNSWNDALEEYKKYHSLAARGEDVEEVLKQTENGDLVDNTDIKVDDIQMVHPITTAASTKEVSSDEGVDDVNNEHREEFHTQETASSSQYHTDRKHPALPPHLIGQVHDEGLKNLLMSWYYAGYYTGLYEGQQQGKASK